MWEEFETSLSSDSLVKLVEEMKDKDIKQVEIYDHFENFRAMLREAGREKDEDSVMEIMDCIAGWCNPHTRLFIHNLSSEEIESYRKTKNAPDE